MSGEVLKMVKKAIADYIQNEIEESGITPRIPYVIMPVTTFIKLETDVLDAYAYESVSLGDVEHAIKAKVVTGYM